MGGLDVFSGDFVDGGYGCGWRSNFGLKGEWQCG